MKKKTLENKIPSAIYWFTNRFSLKVTLLESLILEESFSSIVLNVTSDDGSFFVGLLDMPALDRDFGPAFLLLSSE